jgi:molybdate transport system substrate-binding protein
MRQFLGAMIAALIITGALSARGAEITLIAPGGIRAPLEQIVPEFERQTGHKVLMTITSGGGTKDRVTRGESFDVPIIQPPYETVLASGHVIPDSATPVATVAVGVAVRPGMPRPDIGNAEAVKRTLLAAASISYPDPKGGAAAGVSFTATMQKLGILEAMAPKIRLAQGGDAAMVMLAKGKVELGLTFISEMRAPGIELIGVLPRDISTPTAFVAFLSAQAKEKAAAQSLIRFLASPDRVAAYRAGGMEPGS